jgi:hypothetical protein
MNPWNTTLKVDFDKELLESFKEWHKKIKSFPLNKRRWAVENVILKSEIKEEIERKYLEGYGFKSIARSLEISYSDCRCLLINYFKLKTRKGLDVQTQITIKFKSDRVSGEKNPWFNWPNNKKAMHKNSRGLQGYYKTSKNQYVWLRSSWEYVFAKWLDKNNICWKIEEKFYKLSDKEYYRPDFFIYDENGRLSKIIEVKGYFKNRLYKTKLLSKILKDIDIIVVDDIKNYTDSYKKDLQEWKKLRLSKKELNRLQ